MEEGEIVAADGHRLERDAHIAAGVGVDALVRGGEVDQVGPAGDRSVLIDRDCVAAAVGGPRIEHRRGGHRVARGGSRVLRIGRGGEPEQGQARGWLGVPLFGEQRQVLTPRAGGRIGQQPDRHRRKVVEKLARGGQLGLAGEEVGLAQGDCLVRRRGILQQRLQAELLRIGHRVALHLHRPARRRGEGIGLVRLWQPCLLVFPADPPRDAALLALHGHRGRLQVDFKFVATRAAAQRAAANEGHPAGGVGGIGQSGGVVEVGGRQPSHKAFLFLGAVAAARRPRPAGKPAAGLMIRALPALPHAEHRRTFVGKDVRPGGHPRVEPGLLLQFTQRQQQRHPGIGPRGGHRLALRGLAQRNAREGEQPDHQQRQQHHQRKGDDQGEAPAGACTEVWMDLTLNVGADKHD